MKQTQEKLADLRLSGMLRGLREQIEGGVGIDLSFEERLSLLVDREWIARQENRLARRLRYARLKQQACVEDIDWRHPRGLDKGVLHELASCRWVRAKRNLIITGATGLGKTWLACALADRACREGFTSLYKRVPRLIHEFSIARGDGSYLKALAQLAKVDLLVLDDLGLSLLEGQDQHDLLELIDDRVGCRSTLVTSQLPVNKWHDTVGDPSVADALLDRLLQSSTQIQLKGESMRKEKKETQTDSKTE